MTQAEFYTKAFLAVIQPVTQAYILKHSLPFAKDSDDANERFSERLNEMEAIAETADLLAKKISAYWENEESEYWKEEEAK